MTKIDWSGYNENTTLHEAFGTAGYVLSRLKPYAIGKYAVHPRGKFNETLTVGFPQQLYAWLHEKHGCPCDPYWLT